MYMVRWIKMILGQRLNRICGSYIAQCTNYSEKKSWKSIMSNILFGFMGFTLCCSPVSFVEDCQLRKSGILTYAPICIYIVLMSISIFRYFFHTPFPSSEIWRTMSRREDLLRGILGADQIGFHLFEYARHFLTTCRRLLVQNCSKLQSLCLNGFIVLIW